MESNIHRSVECIPMLLLFISTINVIAVSESFSLKMFVLNYKLDEQCIEKSEIVACRLTGIKLILQKVRSFLRVRCLVLKLMD